MDLCVIGTGYVGLVTGTCFAEFGVNVVCVDKDEDKIARLKGGEIPIYEPGLKELVDKNMAEGRLSFTTELTGSIKKSGVVMIAVGTPPRDDGSTDLSFIEEVATSIGRNLDGYKVVVTKSTVPVGTGKLIERIIEKVSNGRNNFDVASNPEFLREGSAVEDFMEADRVVIGARNSKSAEIIKDLYSPLELKEVPFVITDIESAELIKYASNAFLATKISFVNEIANICDRVGANVQVVAKGMGLDKRIGAKFLHPGPGYGGSCFPKDTLAITNVAREAGYTFEIVEAVIKVNEKRIQDMVDKIKDFVGEIKGTTIGFLGLTFKPNTDDIRESPAIEIILRLMDEGAVVRAYDPAGMDNARAVLPGTVTYCSDSYEVADGSDCLVVATEWNQFWKLDMEKIKGLLKSPKVLDLRNVYAPEEMAAMGFEYDSIGRPAPVDTSKKQ